MSMDIEKVKSRELEFLLSDGANYLVGFRKRQTSAAAAIKAARPGTVEMRELSEELAFLNGMFRAVVEFRMSTISLPEMEEYIKMKSKTV